MTWWQEGVIYQIYPRSFADTDGDGIGNLNGITGKLDYLQALGVDALWLSPVYPSPDVDFGYDVADYCAIDPKFGTLDDFDRLVQAAHDRGLRIILDLVLNHTSDQHDWFVDASTSRSAVHRDWYIWADPAPSGGPPNNWGSVFGGSGWEWHEPTGQYYFHMFYKQQPDVNWHNPQLRQAMLDVFRFWLERGVDGFRLDVFNAFFKDASLRSNPQRFGFALPKYPFAGQVHRYDIDQPEMMPLLADIRAILDEYSTPGHERYAVGETFMGGPEKAAGYMGDHALHAAFNFSFTNSRWNPAKFAAATARWEALLGAERWPNQVLNNHDVTRSATRYRISRKDEENDARLPVAAAMLLTLRGTPFLYYGEEIGMRELPIRRKEDVLDPIGKTFWPLMKGRDGCRTPMQWTGDANAGFSTLQAQTWMPLHPNAAWRNVAVQERDTGSLLQTYRRLLALRRASPALRHGLFQPVTYGSNALWAYLRQSAEQTVLVALNFSGRRQRFVMGSTLARAQWRVLFATHRREGEMLGRLKEGGLLELAAHEVLILEETTAPGA